MKKALCIAAALAVSMLATPLLAKEFSGVKLDDSISVEGKQLTLNGGGIRTKLMVKVYVAGLYVEKVSRDAGQLVASDQVKQVRIVMVRDIGRSKMTDAVEEGFEKNVKEHLAALRSRLDQFKAAIPDLKENDQLVFTYVPGKGTIVKTPAGEKILPGKDFADALFSVWLGKSPADGNLKKGMVGA
jgi:hypothetical protein